MSGSSDGGSAMRCEGGDGPGGEGSGGAWIRVVRPDSAEGELRDVYRSMGACRGVSNILGVQSLHPAALSAHDDLYRTVMFGPSPLSRIERESVAVVVSAANDCFY